MAIGSPIGPVLANIFVSYFESKLFKDAERPLNYFKYVEDIFVLFKMTTKYVLFNKLSSLHPSLKFTIENKVDGSLPFLDVFLQRMYTSIYPFVVFFFPTSQKVNLVSCLVLLEYIKIAQKINLTRKLNILETFLVHWLP